MANQPRFRDRAHAGRELAQELARFRGPDTVVLGLPRGGVAVAYEVAQALEAPLDVCVVRKLGTAMQPDLGVGAVAEGGVSFVRHELAAAYGLDDEQLQDLLRQRRAEVAERVRLLRRGAAPVTVRGKTVVVVDDGVSSGNTARVALRSLRKRVVGRLVLAVPVGPEAEVNKLAFFADEVVCLHPEESFEALALSYHDFSPVTDAHVQELLRRAASESRSLGD